MLLLRLVTDWLTGRSPRSRSRLPSCGATDSAGAVDFDAGYLPVGALICNTGWLVRLDYVPTARTGYLLCPDTLMHSVGYTFPRVTFAPHYRTLRTLVFTFTGCCCIPVPQLVALHCYLPHNCSSGLVVVLVVIPAYVTFAVTLLVDSRCNLASRPAVDVDSGCCDLVDVTFTLPVLPILVVPVVVVDLFGCSDLLFNYVWVILHCRWCPVPVACPRCCSRCYGYPVRSRLTHCPILRHVCRYVYHV